MKDTPKPPPPGDTPEAKAQAQSGSVREPGLPPPAVASGEPQCRPLGFTIGSRVAAATLTRPYSRQRGDPLYRRLRVYALDPNMSRLDGAVATIAVPYEPLPPGPSGALFEVVDFDASRGRHYAQVDLENPFLLMQDGREASAADPLFHQQMAYAVASRVYFSFKLALGRDLAWGFARPGRRRLRIRPHAFRGRNAYYNRLDAELAFGYYAADEEPGPRNIPKATIFTCLSHDIIAHETTHALLDGLRASFMIATGPDVLALHEAIADLVAIFLHFQYPAVVRSALQRARGDLQQPTMLSDLAQQFGQTTGAGRALRFALEELRAEGRLSTYDRRKSSHALGGVLVAAVYEAFVTVYKRKTAQVLRLATGGSGLVPQGALDSDLLDALAERASKLARQFLTICIRAIDYCPSVDVEFGEYLRAMVTADADLVPDDPWAYREALIDAFRRRNVVPASVPSLSEEALRWEPASELPAIRALHFSELKFAGDPATAAGEAELSRQACELGKAIVATPDSLAAFGLAAVGDQGAQEPVVESIRSLRRVGPDNQVVFDLVAEITQGRMAPLYDGGPMFPFLGGATVIIGPEGNVRHTIYKRVLKEERLEAQRQFLQSEEGSRYWVEQDRTLTPRPAPFALLHDRNLD